MRVAGRQQAAAAAVEIAGDVEAAQEGDGFFVAARDPDLLAVQDRRPLRVDEDSASLSISRGSPIERVDAR